MSLKTKLLGSFSMVLLVVVIAYSISANMINTQVEDHLASSSLKSKMVLWQKIANTELNLMEGHTSSVIRSREIKDALAKNDQEGVNENLVGIYNRLSVLNVLDKIEILNVDGKYVGSAPIGRNGSSTMGLVEQALSQGKVSKGFEVDGGQVYLHVVFPLTKRGKLIGASVFSRSLQDALSDFNLHDLSEVVLFDQNGEFSLSTGGKSLEVINWHEMFDSELTFATMKLDERGFFVTLQTLSDWEGKPIGYLGTVTDSTESILYEQRVSLIAYSLIICVLMVSMFLLYWYMNRALHPLKVVADSLDAVSNGDLTNHITVTHSSREVNQLQTAASRMSSKMIEIISQINEVTSDLNKSATQMNEYCGQSQQKVEQQQFEITQVASAIEEMTCSITDVAENASSAAQATHEVEAETSEGKDIVEVGSSSINKLVHEIELGAEELKKLENDTRNMDAVLDVIKGIADQTNLLALNAAIEAARAGDQGRGFAVVADEVRTLAKRTQESTESIRDMLEHYIEMSSKAASSMMTCQELADDSATRSGTIVQAFDSIAVMVSDLDSRNTQIATAAEEQGGVTSSIAKNMAQIKMVSDLTAEVAGNVSESSSKLLSMAEDLNELVDQFKIS